MKGALKRGGLIGVFLMVFAGCDRTCTLTIRGTISAYQVGDRIYVTMANNWRKEEPPTVFSMYQEGMFKIVHKVEGSAPTFTVVRNDAKYAELVLRDLWRYHPSVIDKISGKTFELEIDRDGNVTGKIDL